MSNSPSDSVRSAGNRSLEAWDKMLALRDAAKSMAKAVEAVSGGTMVEEDIRDALRMLFTRFAPFRVGDRVRLTETPEISDKVSWGWLGGKHFLVKGALATVREVNVRDDQFLVGLIFDDDSWVDRDGKRHPVAEKERGAYTFRERFIERVEGKRL